MRGTQTLLMCIKSASHRVIGKLQDSQEHKQHLRMLKPRLKRASELSVKAITRLCNGQTCFYPENSSSSFWLHTSRFFRETHILLMWRYLTLKANYVFCNICIKTIYHFFLHLTIKFKKACFSTLRNK